MSVQFARPSVSDLMFQVFGRSVHPELLTVFDRRVFVTAGYVADVGICEAGHVASFRTDDGTVTEIAATRRSRCLAISVPIASGSRAAAHGRCDLTAESDMK